MQISKKRGLYESTRIVYLPAERIRSNPNQPRKSFDPASMRDLALSVARYGILQPLSVRRLEDGYELITGERRLRAAQLAGLRDIPCIILDVSSPESTALALVENLQRRDLNFIEEAEGLRQLSHIFGYSQSKIAWLVGLSQPAVANKLRILNLPRELLTLMREASLSERHARALLRLKDEGAIMPALHHIIQEKLTVAETDNYIDGLLADSVPPGRAPEKPTKEPLIVVGDVRFFLNTVQRGLEVMQRSGIPAQCSREEGEDEIILTISIPRPGKKK